MSNTYYLVIMAVLVLMSAYFSATETAFSSLSKTRLKTYAEKENKRAELAISLSEKYDKLISTILIGNNIVNIAVASIGTVFFVKHYGDIGATLSTLVVTIVVLIFGEITPKSIAKDSPEKFAMFSAPFINVLIIFFTPLNFLFSLWKKLVSKIFKVEEDSGMSQEELLMLVDEVEQEGSIDGDEGELLRNAIEFTARKAEDILTPRIDIEAVAIDAEKNDIAELFTKTQLSRLMVYNEDIDHIEGVIHQKDFYTGEGITDKPLSEVMTVPVFVHQTEKISELLKDLQTQKSHVAVVLDEYGGTLGIVTMEDILEELVGEIWDEHDEVVDDFKKIDDTTYIVDCSIGLDEFCEFFEIESESESVSLNGWIMEQVEGVPEVGDCFETEGLQITVTETENRRAVKIKAVIIETENENQGKNDD